LSELQITNTNIKVEGEVVVVFSFLIGLKHEVKVFSENRELLAELAMPSLNNASYWSVGASY